MKAELTRRFEFNAAHSLPKVDETHKCKQVHGHNYTVEIAVRGEVDPQYGWVIDFGDLKKAMVPIIETLDHSYLNEIAGLENPTAELIAGWIWDQLKPSISGLYRVSISETAATWCSYWGSDDLLR